MLRLMIFCLLLAEHLHGQNLPIFIKPRYYITNDTYNEMTLIFRTKHDTVFLFYMNIIDNGNYINGFDEKNTRDFAGYFLLKNIKNFSSKFKIKSYRPNYDGGYDKYLLQLTFLPDGKRCYWKIINAPNHIVPYLPEKAMFQQYESH